MSKKLCSYLENIRADQFPKTTKNNGQVVQIGHKETVKRAMKTLNDHQIYSAPIYDDEKGEYVGMVDMVDIVEFIAQNFEEAQMLGEGFEAIFEQAERFGSTSVLELTSQSQRANSFIRVPGDADMHHVVKLLSEDRIHRVNVFNEENQLINIITQSAVLAQLQKKREALGNWANKTVQELDMGTSPVISIDINRTTIEAFKLLREHELYAVPVVNHDLEDAIVANISAKDVRAACIDPSRLYLLYAPISQFLTIMHQNELEIGTPSITCNGKDTLTLLIDKLIINNIHRVYVLDDKNAPERVISLTDLLQTLVD